MKPPHSGHFICYQIKADQSDDVTSMTETSYLNVVPNGIRQQQ